MISESEIEQFNASHHGFVPDHYPTLWDFLTRRRRKNPVATTSHSAGSGDPAYNTQHSTLNTQLSPEAITGALAVADTEPWWRAVHQVIDEMEKETIRSARETTVQPTLCVSHVAAGEGLDMLRKRLKSLRLEGLRLPNGS